MGDLQESEGRMKPEEVISQIEFTTAELVKKRCANQLRIRPDCIRLEAVRHYADELYLRLSAYIYGEDLEPIYIKYPANWWQALKETIFNPGFLQLIHCSVKYKQWVITSEALYPWVSIPNEPHTIRFAVKEVLR